MNKKQKEKSIKKIIIKPTDLNDNVNRKYFFTNISDYVADYMIQKIITDVIYSEFNNNLQIKLKSLLFNYLKSKIGLFLSIYYMAKDEDIEIISDNEKDNMMNATSKDKFKISALEPPFIEFKYSPVIPKNVDNNNIQSPFYIDDSLNNSLFYNNYYQGNNYLPNIQCPSTSPIDRDTCFANPYKLILNDEDDSFNIKEESNLKIEDKYSRRSSSLIKNIFMRHNIKKISSFINIINNPQKENHTKKALAELPIESIKLIEKDVKDKKDYWKKMKEVAKKYDEQRKQMIDENQKRIENEKVKQKLERELQKKIKENSKKNMTVDSKGKEVYIKPLNVDLFPLEFFTINSKIINNIGSNKRKKCGETNSKRELKNIKNMNNEKDEPIINQNSLLYNDGDNYMNIYLNKKNFSISGSSFKLIKPSLGVRINENEHEKFGGKFPNFYDTYNQIYNIVDDKTKKINIFDNKIQELVNDDNSIDSQNKKDINKDNKNNKNKTSRNFTHQHLKSLTKNNKAELNIVQPNKLNSVMSSIDNDDIQKNVNFSYKIKKSLSSSNFYDIDKIKSSLRKDEDNCYDLSVINKFNNTIIRQFKNGINEYTKSLKPPIIPKKINFVGGNQFNRIRYPHIKKINSYKNKKQPSAPSFLPRVELRKNSSMGFLGSDNSFKSFFNN